MSLILGIDLSTKQIDCALLDTDSDRAEFLSYDISATSAFEAARHVRDVLPSRGSWLDRGVILIATESLWSHGRATLKVLSRIQGAVLACLPSELDVLELTPQEWREHSIGDKQAPKESIRSWAQCWESNWTRKLTQDQADAYAIAYACRAMCDQAARRSA